MLVWPVTPTEVKMIKYKIYIALLCLCFVFIDLQAQDESIQTGEVSYVTTKNVYVKFSSTADIQEGDSLYVNVNNQLIKALLVVKKSSRSLVCQPLGEHRFKKGDKILKKKGPSAPTVEVEREEGTIIDPLESERTIPVDKQNEGDLDQSNKGEKKYKQKIRARLSAAMYSRLGNEGQNSSTRMRYRFTMRAEQIADSPLSLEANISYNQRFQQPSEVSTVFRRALRIYGASLSYRVSPVTELIIGRKINAKIANIGAVDGLQFSTRVAGIDIGGFYGTRPDLVDYGFNQNLRQVGAYLHHKIHFKAGAGIRHTLAFSEQRFNGKIDRRYAYVQHQNTILPNLRMFASAELELYRVVDGRAENSLNLTSVYYSLNYRPNKNLNINLAYDSRRNLIFYESYKNFIDRLLENEARQGFQLRVNYRLSKQFSFGSAYSHRLANANRSSSYNLRPYLRLSSVPLLNASMMVSANWFETGFVTGKIFGIRMSRPLIKSVLQADLRYRLVLYDYVRSNVTSQQHITGLNLTWRIMKTLSLIGSVESGINNNGNTRMYLKLIQRFKR